MFGFQTTLCLLAGLSLVVAQDEWQRWCGKHYEEGSPYDIPIGQFPYPAYSEESLLNFQCWPSQTPFLFSDSDGEFLIDSPVSHDVGQPFTISNSSGNPTFSVRITVDGEEQSNLIASQDDLPVNSTGISVPFTLSTLGEPNKTAFKVDCTAVFDDGTTYNTSTVVKYLPENPYGGSTTGIDLYTGAMIVHNESTGTWESILPFGFYTNFDNWLVPNKTTMLPEIKSWGHNLVHPVPTFTNITDLLSVISIMEELGLWLMYDMRWTYKNLTAVREEVERVRGAKNLLLTYTGDEPDGFQDPLDATVLARELIEEVDGYHPVSLVLNCQNYYFEEYTKGADIVMEDVYPVDLHYWNYSTVYNTTCDVNYGDCGCDNCIGSFTDITSRLDTFADWRRLLSRTRSMPLWGVPQAFGDSAWWPREPTGAEWLAMTVLSLNHGALGIIPWDHNTGTTEDVKEASATFGGSLGVLTPFLTGRKVERKVLSANGSAVDVAIWVEEGGNEGLLMVANTGYEDEEWAVETEVEVGGADAVFVDADTTTLTSVEGGQISGSVGAVGSGAWLLKL